MKYVWFFVIVASVTCTKLEVSEFVQNNNALAINIFNDLIKVQKNNFASGVFCLDAIMATVCSGAKGETAREIKTAFNWNYTDAEIAEAFKIAIDELKSVPNLTIHIANKIYLNHHVNVDPKFVKIAENFDTKIENVDFNSSKKAAEKINAWVNEQGGHKLSNTSYEHHLGDPSNLVLMNSLYFKGRWKQPFQLKNTKQTNFYVSKNETKKVDMMKTTGHFLMDKNPKLGIRMLILPYQNEKSHMLIILPDDFDKFQRVEEDVEQLWNERKFKPVNTTVNLPKFEIESTIETIPVLKNMGVTKLFSSADLSGITKQDVTVAAIIQSIFVSIDERGTECDSHIPHVGSENQTSHASSENVEEFIADRPFVFAILYDGFSLLAGKYSGPQRK